MAFLLSFFTRIEHGEEINRVTRTNQRQSMKHIRRTSKGSIERMIYGTVWISFFSLSLSLSRHCITHQLFQRRGKTRLTLVDHNPMHWSYQACRIGNERRTDGKRIVRKCFASLHGHSSSSTVERSAWNRSINQRRKNTPEVVFSGKQNSKRRHVRRH